MFDYRLQYWSVCWQHTIGITNFSYGNPQRMYLIYSCLTVLYTYYFFVQEYLLGDHNQSMLPVAFSLMASFMSAITLLGVSAEVYMYSTLFFMINFGYVFFTPIAAYLFLPVFFKLQATSAYEVNIHFWQLSLLGDIIII